jgi:nitrogen-specific signal transduction histidine kinase
LGFEIMGVFSDVTAQKQAEEKLLGCRHHKDEFGYKLLAHELRNPLAPITMAASILQVGRASRKSKTRKGNEAHMVVRQVEAT